MLVHGEAVEAIYREQFCYVIFLLFLGSIPSIWPVQFVFEKVLLPGLSDKLMQAQLVHSACMHAGMQRSNLVLFKSQHIVDSHGRLHLQIGQSAE